MKNKKLITECKLCGIRIISPIRKLTKFCKSCSVKKRIKDSKSKYKLYKLYRIQINKRLNIIKILNSNGKYKLNISYSKPVTDRVFIEKLYMEQFLIELKYKIDRELDLINSIKFDIDNGNEEK